MRKSIYIVITASFICIACVAQNKYSLQTIINIAKERSVSIQKAKNELNVYRWQYSNYKAERLPTLTLTLTPFQYSRNIIKRYISDSDRDEYRSQRSLYSYGNLQLTQNVNFTGGTLYAVSELGFLRTFGSTTYNQFSTVPYRIGYSQSLFGYNRFKWDRKIEPLKYETAKRKYAYAIETTTYATANLFFDLCLAKENLDLALDQVEKSDTLLIIGETLFKHDALSKSNLLALRLNKMEQEDELLKNRNEYQKKMFQLLSYIGIEDDDSIQIELPTNRPTIAILYRTALEECRRNNPSYLEMSQNILSASKDLDKTKKERFFDTNIDVSIGSNQYSDKFKEAYRNLLQQEVISIGITIPLIDWGMRNGRYKIAKSALETVRAEEKQRIQELEQEIFATVNNYQVQQNVYDRALKAFTLSKTIYVETLEKFKLGAADVKELKDAMTTIKESHRRYVNALCESWLSYMNIRRLTLYDFVKHTSLTIVDFDN